MFKGTPGPWVVRGGYSIYANDGKTPVADACLNGSVATNDEANARLIASAPELLEALTNLLKACNNADAHGELSEFIHEGLLGDAEEAIAKAKGGV